MKRQLIPQSYLSFISFVLVMALASAFFFQTSAQGCQTSAPSDASAAFSRGVSVEQVRLLHTQRGLTNADICVMPEDKLARALNRAVNPKPDHPGEAVAFRLLQQQDENGFIPPDGIAKAQEHVRKMTHVPLLKALPAEAAAVTSAPNSWTWLGPGNIGGRVRSIVIHPVDTNKMWAGSVSGGIWYTSNGGTSWSAVDDFMTNLAVSTLVMDPTNASIMYAGTGEGFYNADGIRGAGVFKSTDGGVTWAQLASTANSSWYYVNRLAISPNGLTLLAATRTGIYRSLDGGASWTPEHPAGVTDWTDIDFDPSDSTKAIAGGYNGKAYYSTNSGDTWIAATWTGAPAGMDRVELAYAPSSTTTVYASVDRSSGQIWKSINGGQTYSQVSTGYNYLGSQGWYDNVIWVNPYDANFVIVGGIDLWRSTNGGANLTQISQWYNAPLSAHADHHAIVQHPNFNNGGNKTVFFGNDGGVYKAADVSTVVGTTGWQELNNTLGITQFYGAAGNVGSGVIVGGTQDNGTLRYSGSTESWTAMYGGDGGFSASDPTNANYFYGEYVYVQIHRSSNAGASSEYISGRYWNGVAWVWKSPPYLIPDAQTSSANFIAPFILDPNNANRILAGGSSLWRTNDAKTANAPASGPSWASIKASVGSNISAIAVAQGNPDIIWVGHNNGNIYKTSNGTAVGPTWTQVDNNTPPLPNRYVHRLTIDPSNHNTVYATFGGFSADNVWRTTDGGSNWTDITGSGLTGLPNVPVRSLVIFPGHSQWLYVGTEIGIFFSSDGGANWAVSQGPANVSVDELFWMGYKLVAATHGRGLYSLGFSQIFVPLAQK